MKSLITGITGFVGSHLAEHLLEKGHKVFGTVRHRSNRANIQHLIGSIELIEGVDITDLHSVQTAIGEVEPDYIFHLAAQSYVPQSWKSPAEVYHVNVIGTSNILVALRNNNHTILHVAGSSEEYGLVYPNELPIRETNPLRPLSPYGVSKVAAELAAIQEHHSYGTETIVTRAFNHTGPRRGDVFVTSNFAKQIAMIEAGLQDPVIYHGNLNAMRDFTDVRDVVKAYLLAVEKCTPGQVYNICSGDKGTYKIQDVLNKLIALSSIDIELKQDPSRMRPSDVSILQGDYSKFKEQTKWEPTIPFERTLEDILNYWKDINGNNR